MELRHLRYFVALAEELNFSRAAARLHLAQPALSRQIQALEEIMGAPLFERTKRRVALTEVGAVLLVQARATLDQAEKTLLTGRRAAAGQEGQLAIAFTSSSMFNPIMPALVHRFRDAFPAVEVALEEMATAEQFTQLRARRIDLGFVRPLASFVREDILLAPVSTEGVVVALRETHPLAAAARLHLAELVDETFLVHPPEQGSSLGEILDRIAGLRGGPLKVAQQAREVPALIHLAAAGMGIALVPESMCCVRVPHIRYVPLADPGTALVLALAYRRGEQAPSATNFLRMVKPLDV